MKNGPERRQVHEIVVAARGEIQGKDAELEPGQAGAILYHANRAEVIPDAVNRREIARFSFDFAKLPD